MAKHEYVGKLVFDNACHVCGMELGTRGIYGKVIEPMTQKDAYLCYYELGDDDRVAALILTTDTTTLPREFPEGKLVHCKDICVGFFTEDPSMSAITHDAIMDTVLRADDLPDPFVAVGRLPKPEDRPLEAFWTISMRPDEIALSVVYDTDESGNTYIAHARLDV